MIIPLVLITIVLSLIAWQTKPTPEISFEYWEMGPEVTGKAEIMTNWCVTTPGGQKFVARVPYGGLHRIDKFSASYNAREAAKRMALDAGAITFAQYAK